jgi:hypothetical protein
MICLSSNNDGHPVTKIFTMFLFHYKHALKDVPHFEKQTCSTGHVANQQSNVTSLFALFTAAGYRASRAKLFDPSWLLTKHIFSSLNVK